MGGIGVAKSRNIGAIGAQEIILEGQLGNFGMAVNVAGQNRSMVGGVSTGPFGGELGGLHSGRWVPHMPQLCQMHLGIFSSDIQVNYGTGQDVDYKKSPKPIIRVLPTL